MAREGPGEESVSYETAVNHRIGEWRLIVQEAKAHPELQRRGKGRKDVHRIQYPEFFFSIWEGNMTPRGNTVFCKTSTSRMRDVSSHCSLFLLQELLLPWQFLQCLVYTLSARKWSLPRFSLKIDPVCSRQRSWSIYLTSLYDDVTIYTVPDSRIK
jgi:hypothetical protein